MSPSSDAVESYHAQAGETGRAFLLGVREVVHRHAPDATETMSYDMPTFLVDGRRLLHASAWSQHLAIYPLPPAEYLDPEATAAVAAHSSGASTLKLPYREEFPTLVVDAVVRAHLARVAAGR